MELKTLAIGEIVGIAGTTNLDSPCFGGKALMGAGLFYYCYDPFVGSFEPCSSSAFVCTST